MTAPRFETSEARAAAEAAAMIAGRRFPREKALATVEGAYHVHVPPALLASELRRWFACFAPDAHKAVLLAKRQAALAAMRSLRDFAPVLTGSVLSGEALEDDPVCLHIRTDDEKAVELALLAMDVPFEAADEGRDVLLMTECLGEPVLLTVTRRPIPVKSSIPDAWQCPQEAAGKLNEADLCALLNAD